MEPYDIGHKGQNWHNLPSPPVEDFADFSSLVQPVAPFEPTIEETVELYRQSGEIIETEDIAEVVHKRSSLSDPSGHTTYVPPQRRFTDHRSEEFQIPESRLELEDRLLEAQGRKLENRASLWELTKIAGSEYNTIGALRQTLAAQKEAGITNSFQREALNIPDPNFYPPDYPELFEDIPPAFHQEITHANNLDDARWKSIRIRNSLANIDRMATRGIGANLTASIGPALLDPVALAIAFGLTKGAGYVVKGRKIGQTMEAVRQSQSVAARTALMATEGVALGAGTEAARTGLQSVWDPAMNTERVIAETIGGAVGSLVLPLGYGAYGVAKGLRGTPSSTPAQRHATARQSVSEGTTAITEGVKEGKLGISTKLSVANNIGGKTVFDVANLKGGRHSEIANLLFENPVGLVGGEAMPNTASINKQRTLKVAVSNMDYTGGVREWVNTQTRNPAKAAWATWTDSQLRAEYDEQLSHALIRAVYGSDVQLAGVDPMIAEHTRRHVAVLNKLHQGEVRANVEGAQGSSPLTMNLSAAKILDYATAISRDSVGDQYPLKVEEAVDHLSSRLGEILGKGMREDDQLFSDVDKILKRALPILEDFDRFAMVDRILEEYGYRVATARIHNTRTKAVDASALHSRDFSGDTLAILLDDIGDVSPLGKQATRDLQETLARAQGRDELTYLRAIGQGDVDFLHGIVDTDMATGLARMVEESTGRTALAEVGFTSPRVYKEITRELTEEAVLNPNLTEYPVNFFDDVWQSFHGRPTSGIFDGEGMTPAMRRLRMASGFAKMGLAGFSMVSDSANVLARGPSGIRGFFEGIPLTIRQMFSQQTQDEVLASLETMSGNLIQQHRFYRGDVHLDQIAKVEAQRLGMLKSIQTGATARLDNVLAGSSRALGAVSGMNAVNTFTAIAAEKTILHEISRYFKKGGRITNRQKRLLAEIGFDEATLERIRPEWEANVEYGKFGGVKKLNAGGFSGEAHAIIGNGMNRGVAYMMSEALIGELPNRMMTPIFQILLHLRQSTMVQHEKAWRRGIDVGVASMVPYITAAMGLGMASQYSREFTKEFAKTGDMEGAIEKANALFYDDAGWSPGVRRAISNIPQLSGITDTSSTVLAPLVGFFIDEDYGNALHFQYNAFDYGPPRADWNAVADQIPALSYLSSAGQMVGGAGLWAKDPRVGDNWDDFIEGLFGIMPLGNTAPGIAAMNILLDDSNDDAFAAPRTGR